MTQVPKSIRTQTLLLSAVPLVFLVLLLGLALFLQGRNATVAAESQRLNAILAGGDRAGELLDKASASVLAYDRTHHDSALGPYRMVLTALPEEMTALDGLVSHGPRNRTSLVRLRRATLGGLAVITEYLHDAQRRDDAAKKALVNSPRVRALTDEIAAARSNFSLQQRITTTRRLRRLAGQITALTIASIVLCIVGIAVTLMLSLRFGMRITTRITRLAENARQLAAGEDAEPIGGRDEIAELDRVYREMTTRTQREHDMVMTMQHALLPETLPTITGVRLDAAYVPASSDAEVGGDWYDVFSISDRLLGISVGDVAGHGLRAATIMGQARQTLRTASYAHEDPGEVLGYVNRVLCRSEENVLITAFFATLDLEDGTLRYALAGHPPPMFVRTGGSVEMLPGRGFVLGVDARVPFDSHEAKADVGSAVVFFTDGLVEADRDYMGGIEILRDAIEQEYRNAEHNIAQAIVARVFAKRQPRDDVALLFLAVTALGAATLRPQRLCWEVDAAVERSARRVKRALLWQLGEMTDGVVDLSAAELVVNELLGNVARHTPGPAEVYLEWEHDTAVVRVCDRGEPFEPPAADAPISPFAEDGRGLFLVHSVSSNLTVERTSEGNCVSVVLPVRVRERQAV